MHTLFILILAPLMVFATSLSAFELIHSDYGKDFYFVFNGGSKDGVTIGMTACVFDDSDEELFCGPVSKVNKSKAGVFAGADQEAWLEQGFYVTVKELKNHPRNGRQSKVSQALASQTFAPAPKRHPRWGSSLVMTPILPFQYAHPVFSIDARMAGEGSLWSSGESVKQSLVGATFYRRGALVGWIDHEISLLGRYVRPIQTDSDFDPNSGDVYAVEKSKATDFALSWIAITPISTGDLATSWNSGLGVESMSFDYASSIVDDSGGTQSGDLAASKAALTGAFLKLGLAIDKSLGRKTEYGPKGLISFNVATLLPVYSKTTWKHGTHTLPSDVTQRDSSQSQFEDAAKFKKGTFGIETSLSASWMF